MIDLKYFTTDKAFYKDKDIRDGWIDEPDSPFPLIRFHSLDQMDWLDAWATSRRGGVSKGCFSSLNLGFNTGDEPDLVRENIRLLEERLGLGPQTLVRSHQVHGTRILDLTRAHPDRNGKDASAGAGPADQARPSSDGPDLTPYEDLLRLYSGYDGFYTDQPGLALAVSVADCVPILLADPVSRQVSAVHSGWKGTVGKIGAGAVAAMAANGSRPRDMTAVIGPSISGSHYEVTGDLVREFSQVFSPEQMKTIAVRTDDIHYLLDLWAACWYYLRQAGLKEENIHFSGLCTFENWQELFSHRRSGGRRGIMNCLIKIRESKEN